ncbi:MAG: hypothetical protein ACREO1_08925 [Arenimonas sp.]
MSRLIWIILALLLLLVGWQSLGSSSTPQYLAASSNGNAGCPLPEKFTNPDKPLQSDVNNRIQAMQLGNTRIVPLAGISLQARVLSREDYRLGTEAEFSPTDLALGWGPMAKLGMADKLNINQSGRFYRYSWGNEGPPIPPNEIISNSANMHLVPSSTSVAEMLGRVSSDDIVELQGWLIRIEKSDGWRWQSSLSRDDTGSGACELVYVCAIEVKP